MQRSPKMSWILRLLMALCATVFSLCDGLIRTRNPMQNPDLYQGDILGIENNEDRNAIVDMRERWPGGIIPYRFDRGLAEHQKLIEQAMRDIEKNTCLKFVPYDRTQKGYLRIFPGDGCYSLLGYSGRIQPLSIGDGCEYLGIVIHELVHAVGFDHEQNRSDRDDYLIIYWMNIEEEAWDQFQKNHPNNNWLINDFDYDSIMLYGETAFSRDGNLITMASKKKGKKLVDVDVKGKLSPSDIFRINTLYDCK